MGPTERTLMMAQYAGNGQVLLDSAGMLFVLAGLSFLCCLIVVAICLCAVNEFVDWYNKKKLKKEFEEEEDDIHTKT